MRDRLYTVSRQSAAVDEVALTLARRQELLVGQTEHLDDARQLVALILAREQWVPGQQLHHDTPCTRTSRQHASLARCDSHSHSHRCE